MENSVKFPSKIDVAVLLLFFNRTETFAQVFEQVRLARPSKLFLYQDGMRNGSDLSGIESCRAIAENIDWECEVHRLYQEKNLGCDPSGFMAQRWAFSQTDKCIVLEDDVVPSQSFFHFCKAMLDRYEHDERISLISGFNTDEITPDCPYDYFFTSTFSIWGWASWSRVVGQWEGDYAFLDDGYNMLQMKALAKSKKLRKNMIPVFFLHRGSGKAYHETISQASMLLNSGLAIVPTKNLVNNIGFGGGTHFSSQLETMPQGFRRQFMMARHELHFPLKHPKYVIENVEYKERLYRLNAWNNPLRKIKYSLEELWLNLRHGRFTNIGKSLINRVKKWTGNDKHA